MINKYSNDKKLEMLEKELPFGSLEKEIADDIPVMLSEGEYVVPADVVRYWGLKHLEDMRMMAKCGLMSLQDDGRLHVVDEDGEPVETAESEEAHDAPMLEIVEIDLEAMQEDAESPMEDMEDEEDEEESNVIEVDFDGKGIEEDILMLKNGGGVAGDDVGGEAGTSDYGGDEGNDNNDGDSDGDGAGGSVEGEGPADADLGATPAEEAAMTGMGNMAGLEDSLDYSAQYDKITEKMSTQEIANAAQYGVFNSMNTMQHVGRAKDPVAEVDKIAEARHSHNPTNAQLGLNALTEKGFQMANPGITQAVGVMGTLMAGINPAFGAVMAIGNLVNKATGGQTLGDLSGMSGLMSGVGDKLGFDVDLGIEQGIKDIGTSIGEFASTVPGTPDDTPDTPGDVATSGKKINKEMQDLAKLQEMLNQTAKLEGGQEVPLSNSLMSAAINTEEEEEESDIPVVA
jgi:hypothetical protein